MQRLCVRQLSAWYFTGRLRSRLCLVLVLGISPGYLLAGGEADGNVTSNVKPASDQGRSRAAATIVIPEASTAHRRETAALLGRYIEKSTGAELPIGSVAGEGLAIHVGRSPYVDSLDLDIDSLDADGFVLKGVDKRNYVIVGPTDYGTEFGVCEFLERYLGVRWLLPGEHGTDVPKRSALHVSPNEVRGEPAFYSRFMSGLQTKDQQTWARRLRMHGRIAFHHNLYKLFPPSEYAASHPEFFPVLSGRRYLPVDDNDQGWQPVFTADGLADEAIYRIKQHFRDFPDETSYSLGINDSRDFDQSATSLAGKQVTRNYLGLRDFSDDYFRWCTEVVRGVEEEFPDKRFGCLAYGNVAEPPTHVEVHRRIVPFLTYDRMQWIDPKRREFGQELTRRWQAVCPEVGWYDYVHGSPYCLPRFYPHLMADNLRFGRDHGVRAHYSEAFPNWGEGPKLYMLLKLLWDPDIDVDAVLQEWYVRCVGADAAPLLAEYYLIWERFWMETIPRSDWFRRARQRLAFESPDYLAEVDETALRRCRQLLDSCVGKARTGEQRARAELLRTAFEYYESSVLSYRAKIVTRDRHLTSEEDVLRAIEDDVERIEASGRRVAFVRRYRNHPVLGTALGWDGHPQLRGEAWDSGLLWPVLDSICESGRVRQRIEALVEHTLPSVRLRAVALLQASDGRMDEYRLSGDPSFEGESVDPWRRWIRWGIGSARRVVDRARTGSYSLLCDGVRHGGPHQTIPVEPGRYLAFGYAFIAEGQESSGTVTITATMRGRDNQNLPTPTTEVKPTPGAWTPIGCLINVPLEVNDIPVTQVRLIAIVDGFQPGEKVYLDDIALYHLPDEW